MADALVSFLLKKLEGYLSDEVFLLLGVEKETNSLKDDLKILLGICKDAEDKKLESKAIQEWLSQITQIVSESEDVFDHLRRKSPGEESSNTDFFHKYFCAVIDALKEILERHIAGEKIKVLKDRVDVVRKRGQNYGLIEVIIVRPLRGREDSSPHLLMSLEVEDSSPLKSMSSEGSDYPCSSWVLSSCSSPVEVMSSKGEGSSPLKAIAMSSAGRMGDKQDSLLPLPLSSADRRDQEDSLSVLSMSSAGRKKRARKKMAPTIDERPRRLLTSSELVNDVVGRQKDIKTLLGKLLDNKTGRFAISICGTDGLGKTTLARKLYHDVRVKHKFQVCAWICVSQDYNMEDLLRRIISSFDFATREESEEVEKMKEEALKNHLHESLKERSYFVVIDDVPDNYPWTSLLEAFPCNEHGSRVIMTTGDTKVPAFADYVHELGRLSEDESWQLFCAKTFEKAYESEELEELGKQMVQKCCGLPLPIVVLGGLLSEKSSDKWRSVDSHIRQYLNSDSDYKKYLLPLCFNDLSPELKLCFLYLGHFPEGFKIPTEKLIQLWEAEGFIAQKDDAYFNLCELVKRSLVQIDKTRRGRTITCRVHNLWRDEAIRKAQELNLYHIYHGVKDSTGSSGTRRQVVYSELESCLKDKKSEVLRSLLFFNINHTEVRENLLTVCSNFLLLRVLDLSYLSIKTIPREIEELILLRHLGLTETGIRDVPEFILNLVSLQTLNLLGLNSFPRLPTKISKLQELRHLIGNFKGSIEIDNLTNLHTLKSIQGETWIKTNPEGLVYLRELHISGYDGEEKEFTFDSMAKLIRLQILRVCKTRGRIPSLQPLSYCLSPVELTLRGRIERLPEEMYAFLSNLEYLELYDSKLVDDPMATLEKLPNLAVLYLGNDCYDGTKLVCSKGGFPQLKILAIFGSHLDELQVAEGAMPELKSFMISSSDGKTDIQIPERLKILPAPARWEYDSSVSDQC